jgi:glutathione S-transferase
VIIAYLERACPNVPLYPAGAADFARALWLEEYADTRLREVTLPFISERLVKPIFQGKPGDESALPPAAGPRDETFGYLERALADRPFAQGFTVADLAVGAQLVTLCPRCRAGGHGPVAGPGGLPGAPPCPTPLGARPGGGGGRPGGGAGPAQGLTSGTRAGPAAPVKSWGAWC